MIRSTTALAAALALGVAGAALAQATQTFPQEKLEAFAEAAVAVREIRNDVSAELQKAGSPDEQRRLLDEASARMTAEVEESPGITVEEYNAIAAAAQEDPAIAGRIANLMSDAAR